MIEGEMGKSPISRNPVFGGGGESRRRLSISEIVGSYGSVTIEGSDLLDGTGLA